MIKTKSMLSGSRLAVPTPMGFINIIQPHEPKVKTALSKRLTVQIKEFAEWYKKSLIGTVKEERPPCMVCPDGWIWNCGMTGNCCKDFNLYTIKREDRGG